MKTFSDIFANSLAYFWILWFTFFLMGLIIRQETICFFLGITSGLTVAICYLIVEIKYLIKEAEY